MATKMFDVKRPLQFVRPDGSSVSLQPGLQEIDATPYKGADGKAAGVDNMKSDADHWFLNQPENATLVQTKAEKDAADQAAKDQPAADAAAAKAASSAAAQPDPNGKDAGTPAAPAGGGEAKGTAAASTATK